MAYASEQLAISGIDRRPARYSGGHTSARQSSCGARQGSRAVRVRGLVRCASGVVTPGIEQSVRFRAGG
jgi:hypothetical protein